MLTLNVSRQRLPDHVFLEEVKTNHLTRQHDYRHINIITLS